MSKPSEGYFAAKRQLQDALNHRLSVYDKEMKALPRDADSVELHRALRIRMQEVEQLYQFVRNGMLWDTSKGE